MTTATTDIDKTDAAHANQRPDGIRRLQPRYLDWHAGVLMSWHVLAGDSGGALSLGEALVRAGDEPPLHVHAREDETWYVIEGMVLFQVGHERVLAPAGTAVLLPRGIAHGFAVQSGVARILHAYTPGGLEAAFRSLSVPAPRPELPPPSAPPDAAQLARFVEVYGAHGVTFVGPPLPAILAQESEVR